MLGLFRLVTGAKAILSRLSSEPGHRRDHQGFRHRTDHNVPDPDLVRAIDGWSNGYVLVRRPRSDYNYTEVTSETG